MAASVYYIDGYNVIHHSALLKPLARESFERAREVLVERVARFCVATGHAAKVIFDGRGRVAEPVAVIPRVAGLEVIYSPGHLTADALIERTVYQATDRRAIVVVTRDRGIRGLCRNLGTLVMEPDNFLASIRETDEATRAALQNLDRRDTLLRIEARLPAAVLQHLRALRDKLRR